MNWNISYGIRKPHPGFFQLAMDEIKKEYPGTQKEDILYVGNDYRMDVEGAGLAASFLLCALYKITKIHVIFSTCKHNAMSVN